MSSSKIAYALRRYPVLSETFVSSEVRSISKRYGSIIVLSLLNDKILTSDKKDDKIDIWYLKYSNVSSLIKIIVECAMHPNWCTKIFIYAIKTLFLNLKLALQTIYLIPRIVTFASICSKENVTHIHSHFSGIASLSGQFISKLLKCRYSFMFHTLPELNGPVIEWNVIEASNILVNSIVNMEAIKEKFGDIVNDKIHLVRSSLGLKIRNIEALESREFELDIISVGRLVPEKGFDILIKALSNLKNFGYEPSCGIIGNGPEKDRLDNIIKMSSLQNVHLYGSLPNEKVFKLLYKSKIFVLPCRRTAYGEDGLPVAILESLASGVPVISCDIGGINEVVIEEETGFLVFENDVDALCEAIIKLLENEKLRNSMSRNAVLLIMKLFDKNKALQDLASIFSI